MKTIGVEDLEQTIEGIDLQAAKAIYDEHGALVLRGVAKEFAAAILGDMNTVLDQAIALLPQAKRHAVHKRAWVTPDGTSFNDDPDHPGQKVVNTLRFNGLVSGAFTESLMNPRLLDVVEALIGPDIELWKWGQCVYKQPESGLPKSMHQDEYYFQHKYNTTVGVLTYAIDTDERNGALQVVPGSHKLGPVTHEDDTFAGFRLDDSWFDRAVLVPGEAGDAILFNGLTIHGSLPNRSTRPRPVFIQRYRAAYDFCIIDVGNSADRREAEANPRTEKAPDDLGLMVRGLRRDPV
jgi:ectoine hydroxylase-related dioxygenase (phytanoyl-CoA dioxygenase family)